MGTGTESTAIDPERAVEVVPVTPARWQDLVDLFATAADPSACWCMYWRYGVREYQAMPGAERRRRLRERVEQGRVPGLLAYADGRVVGWCSLSPREDYQRVQRSPTLRPVDGAAVWAVVCFYVLRAYRRRGIARALLRAAVEVARQSGAEAVEGYPVVPTRAKLAAPAAFPGTVELFEQVGFEEIARRSAAKAIMRYRLRPESSAAADSKAEHRPA
jgi:GNAT superfamily N-acetyltransferase